MRLDERQLSIVNDEFLHRRQRLKIVEGHVRQSIVRENQRMKTGAVSVRGRKSD